MSINTAASVIRQRTYSFFMVVVLSLFGVPKIQTELVEVWFNGVSFRVRSVRLLDGNIINADT